MVEVVRDRCGRERDIRTSELFEKICNFLGEDCCVSLKTVSKHFGVGVGTAYRQFVKSFFPGKVLSGKKKKQKKNTHSDGHQNCPSSSLQSRPFSSNWRRTSWAVILKTLRRWRSPEHLHFGWLLWSFHELAEELQEVNWSRRILLWRRFSFVLLWN